MTERITWISEGRRFPGYWIHPEAVCPVSLFATPVIEYRRELDRPLKEGGGCAPACRTGG